MLFRSSRTIAPAVHAPARGATLVEVLVAVSLLTFGLLALSGTDAELSRLAGGARRLTVAAHLAERRLELLRAGGCVALAGGSASQPAVSERWFVTPVAAGAYEIADTVTSLISSRRDSVRLAVRSVVRC